MLECRESAQEGWPRVGRPGRDPSQWEQQGNAGRARPPTQSAEVETKEIDPKSVQNGEEIAIQDLPQKETLLGRGR